MNKVQTEDSICLYPLAFEDQQQESVHIKFSIAYSVDRLQNLLLTLLEKAESTTQGRTLIPYYKESYMKKIVFKEEVTY